MGIVLDEYPYCIALRTGRVHSVYKTKEEAVTAGKKLANEGIACFVLNESGKVIDRLGFRTKG